MPNRETISHPPEGKISISGSGDVNGAIVGKAVGASISRRRQALYDETVVARVLTKELWILTWEIN
ncbi:MAG: hypothetical protein ACOC7P_02555 [Chloroflexota bacterium]